MSDRSPRDVVRSLLAGVAAGGGPALADLYAADAAVELPFAGPGGLRLQGRDALRSHFARAAALPLRLTPRDVVLHATTDEELVVAEYDYHGTVRTTGRSFVAANVQLVRVRSGLIVGSRDFHDHAAIAGALNAAGE